MFSLDDPFIMTLSEIAADFFTSPNTDVSAVATKLIGSQAWVGEFTSKLFMSEDIDPQIFQLLPEGFRPLDQEQAQVYGSLLKIVRSAISEHWTSSRLVEALAVVHPLIGEFDTAIKLAILNDQRQALLTLLPPGKRFGANLAITLIRKHRLTLQIS